METKVVIMLWPIELEKIISELSDFFETYKVSTNKSGFKKFAGKYQVWKVFLEHGNLP